ncbi:unnamed protein product, partial [Rotaria sp. Silwood1]
KPNKAIVDIHVCTMGSVSELDIEDSFD